MIVRLAICYFKTRCESRATKGDKRRIPSTTKGMKEESGGKKVDQFERLTCERTSYLILSFILIVKRPCVKDDWFICGLFT